MHPPDGGGSATGPGRYALVVHGGAGVITREDLTPEQEAAVRAALGDALEAGEAILRADGSALDAVTAAVRSLEDSPWFNAGRGSVLNREGHCEMDASIMEGATRRAGAVSGVREVRNPVLAARAVMERSAHVFLAGPGADAFARQEGLELAPPEYFVTEARRKQWRRIVDQLRTAAPQAPLWPLERKSDALGTVGAVAADRAGHVAAATSTGGLAGKLPGRVGDSPVIGAGTYADDATCAVSATGHGEFFLRAVVAHDVAARMRYRGLTVEAAAREVVWGELVASGGEGGVIAVDRGGRVAWPFNTPGMYRGAAREGEGREIRIYRESDGD